MRPLSVLVTSLLITTAAPTSLISAGEAPHHEAAWSVMADYTDKQFEYSGTNGFAARIEAVSQDGN